jgi:zinc transporter, ZIP family
LSASAIIWLGFSASLLAGLCTGVGAGGVFVIRKLSEWVENGLLSVAAGIMLAATFFSLLLPALDYGSARFASEPLAVGIVILGLFSGAAALYLVHSYVPHEHFFVGVEGPDPATLSRIWLFVAAITLHNFPEGMAVGVGFAGGDVANGASLATGIGIQNVPEGLAVAVSLLTVGYSRLHAFGVAFLTGLVEPVGGLFGSAAVTLAAPIMPWTLGFAAGAMLFIISGEIIPETHRGKSPHLATAALLAGFALMMFLDTTLG